MARLLLAFIVQVMPGCREGDPSLERVRQAGSLRVGYAVEGPYAYLEAGGRVTGESPEIARVVAARLGVPRIEWRLCEFGLLIRGLQSGQFDMIAAGMFVTPEREALIAFSRPTFQVGSGLLVRRGNPLRLKASADLLANAAARVAVLSGSVEEQGLVAQGLPASRLVRVPDARSGMASVLAGDADGLALSLPTIRWMARQSDGEAEAVELGGGVAGGGAEGAEGATRDRGGFGFRKEDRALREAWDAVLVDFVGSPEHLRVVERLGFRAEDLPAPAAGGRP